MICQWRADQLFAEAELIIASIIVLSFDHHVCFLMNTQLENTAHEQLIICRQLFAGHVVDCRPMKRKKNLHRMIMTIIILCTHNLSSHWLRAHS